MMRACKAPTWPPAIFFLYLFIHIFFSLGLKENDQIRQELILITKIFI